MSERRCGPRRLFWRVYLYGFGVLLFLELALIAFGALYMTPRFQRRAQRMTDYVAERLASEAPDPQSTHRWIQDLAGRLEGEMSVYAEDGSLVASTIAPPLALQYESTMRRFPAFGPPSVMVSHIENHDESRGWVIVSLRSETEVLYGLAIVEIASLAVVALFGLFLVRSLTRPLEQLSQAARRLGAGELDARVPSPRRLDEIGELALSFNEMAERLSHQLLAEKEMMANISHELRTPLARIRVVLDLAEDESGSGSATQRYLSEIVRDLGEIDRLVEDVLCASRLDLAARRAGSGTPLRLGKARLGDIVEEARRRFSEAHPERELRIEQEPGLPVVEVDASLLRRALHNLLDNARKYSPQDTPIILRSFDRADALVFEVSDQGVGVAPEDLPRLFEPFFRADRSRTRSTGGLGLGLALVKRIIEAHRGRVEVESSLGRGTTARLLLPRPGDAY